MTPNRRILLQVLTGAVLLLVSAYFRFSLPDDSLTLDEADYALAARKGLAANYLDREDTRSLRHWHGPMIAYLPYLSTAVFGETEWSVRFPSRLLGTLTPLIAFLFCLYIFPSGFIPATVTAFLLATMPISAHVSHIANAHTFVTLLLLLCFFFVYLFYEKKKPVYLYLLSITLAVYFTALEYAFIVLGIIAVIFILYPSDYFVLRWKRIVISRHVVFAVVLIPIVMTALWGAGIFDMHALKNLIFYVGYKQHTRMVSFVGELTRTIPHWAYLYWYWKLAPVFLILTITALGYLLYSVIKNPRDRLRGFLFVFLVVLLAALFKQHISSARYSVHLIPFFSLAIAMMSTDLLKRLNALKVIGAAAILLAVLLTNLPNIYPSAVGDPGYNKAAAYLQTHSAKDARILSWYSGILQFYLPEFSTIDNYNSGGATDAVIDRLKSRHYDHIVLYANQKSRFPDDVGYRYIEEGYRLEKTFFWRNEPVLWIYTKKENPH